MSSWSGKSRGNLLGYKIVVASLKLFGLNATYFLVRLISFYFYLFAGKPKRVLIDFYQKGMGYSLPEARAYCRENFYLLAQNLLDRMAFALGLGQKIKYTQKGEQTLVDWAQKKEGGLLFSGHIGNWAIAGNLLKDLDVKVNVLMLDNEHERLKEFLKSQQRQPQFNVIPIKEDLSHLVEIYKAVKRGELVCINADRFIEGAKTIDVSFLNKTIKLPEGPFILAKKLKVKYTFVFAVKSGKFDYHFSSTPPVHATSDEKKIAQDFANELEVVVKEYPQQWFNYYDVFNA